MTRWVSFSKTILIIMVTNGETSFYVTVVCHNQVEASVATVKLSQFAVGEFAVGEW